MSGPSPELPPRETPHIRLNSGQHDVFSDEDPISPVSSPPPPPPPEHGRPLTPLTPQVSESQSTGTLQTVYTTYHHGSTEFLIPPRPHRTRDELASPNLSVLSSRRTSWDSEAGSYDTRGYSQSRVPSRAGSDENDVNTQTVTEKYNITPTDGLLLFPEDVEKDDYLHNPDPSDRERECDIWNRRGLINVGGLVLLSIGFLVLFIGYPVM